jgi:50S ribosomal protein L16 3-hydroxylase
MLYLPPRYAHDGVAVDACTTYSIGFRAPAHQELAEAFLDHVRDTLNVPGRYADRGLRASRHPAQLDAATVRRLAAPLARIRWRNADVARFIGRFLSEPKPHVTFEPPARIAPRAFAARARRAGVRLDLRTQLLYDAREVYVNGARVLPGARTRAALQRLADARALEAAALQRAPAELFDVLHDWYAHGYLEFDAS